MVGLLLYNIYCNKRMKRIQFSLRKITYSVAIVIAIVLIHQIIYKFNRDNSRPAQRIHLPVEDECRFITMWTMTSKNKSRVSNKVENVKRKILYWTNFFGIISDEYVNQQTKCKCQYTCQLTANRAEIKSSDAVMFHLYDIWADNWVLNTTKLVPIPNYRHPSQVWVIANMEPLGNLWGNFDILNGLFNWTMTYRKDSTHLLPYGQVNIFNFKESKEHKAVNKVNYFRQKNRAAVARVSNCNDYARRYKLIKRVKKYLDVDLFGKCYGNVCGSSTNDPYEAKCDDILKEYRFYLAFENSFCKDYVTEKYWLSLKREQIPIVNWKHVNLSLVIPNSYINVFDFPDIESFGKYIMSVNSNETLYNSYFEWKLKYSHTSECISCITCRALHEQTETAQSYTDFAGWIKNDFCEDVTEQNIWRKNYDRYKFDYIETLYHV